MADRVIPTVRLIFPADDAILDLADGNWQLKNPWGSVLALPPGSRFPFRAEEAWVYVQLTDGVGEFRLSVELRQLRDDRTRRTVGWSEATPYNLPGGAQIFSTDAVFRLKNLPFREAGLYEFYVTAEDERAGDRIELPGQTAVIRVLDLGVGL